MSALSNLFSDLPRHFPDEVVATLLEAPDCRIERIVSHGHSTPEGFWYDQDRMNGLWCCEARRDFVLKIASSN